MKKIISLVLVVVMVLVLSAACGGQTPDSGGAGGGAGPANTAGGGDDSSGGATGDGAAAGGAVYELKASTYLPGPDPLMALIDNYCNSVSESTGGNLTIKVYPGEQLGPYDQTFEETIRGSIEFGFNAVPATYDTRLEAVFVPGAIGTYERMGQLIAPGSTVFNTYDSALDDLGIVLLGWVLGGYNNIILRGEPEAGYVDPTVQKTSTIRVPTASAMFGHIISSLGYRTASLNGNEVYSALQTGVVDGSMGQSNMFVLSGFSDVVANIIDTRLVASIDPIFINKDVFESMPPEYQQALRDAAKDFLEENLAFLEQQDAEVESQLADIGITVIHLSDDERSVMESSVRDAVWPVIEQSLGADFLEGVKKDVGIQ